VRVIQRRGRSGGEGKQRDREQAVRHFWHGEAPLAG
jgi:hypothetical protein